LEPAEVDTIRESLASAWIDTKVRRGPGPNAAVECTVEVIRELVHKVGSLPALTLWFEMLEGPLAGHILPVQLTLTEKGLFFGKAALQRLGVTSPNELGTGALVGRRARAVVVNPTGSRHLLEILEILPSSTPAAKAA
jgi:hypothetical protein